MDALSAILPPDAKRDATHSIRGFDWQRWITVEAWLGLAGEDDLWIEWAEDLILVSENEIITVQAKDRAASITLGDANVLKLIDLAFQREARVSTEMWATSRIGLERDRPFPEPGVEHWRKVAAGESPPDALRAYLSKAPALSEKSRALVVEADDATLLRLLGRVRWRVGEPPIEDLRRRVESLTERRMIDLGILGASVLRAEMAEALFGAISTTGLKPVVERRLTRVALDGALLRAHRIRQDVAAAEATHRPPHGAPPLALDGPPEGPNAPEPFTPTWFVYSEQAIPLIGREAELARLETFADRPEPFLWWEIGGAGGVGKSRLVQDFMKGLDGWTTGFATTSNLAGLADQLRGEARACVAIDYAAVDPQSVEAFLKRCATRQSPGQKLRVLTLDRDMSGTAFWRQRSAPSFGSQKAALDRTQHAPPLTLQPLSRHIRVVVEAWLTAAQGDASATLPEPTSPLWDKIARLTEGRPLLLGFVAAALANGRPEFDSISTLLDTLLEREAFRWRGFRPDGALPGPIMGTIAVATAARGLMDPQHDSSAVIHIVKDGAVRTVTGQDGRLQLPTVAYALADPETAEIAQEALEQAWRRLQDCLRPVTEGGDPTDAYRQAAELAGPSRNLEPDLLGEYFLARHWRAARAFEAPAAITPATDVALGAQIHAAWRLNAWKTLFTLDQLRAQTWGYPAAVRALSALASSIAADGREEPAILIHLSSLLYNCVVKLGGVKASPEDRLTLFEALHTLSAAFPDNRQVAYRRLKALKAAVIDAGRDTDGARAREFVHLAPALIATSRTMPDDQFLPHMADIANHAAIRAGELRQAEPVKAALLLLHQLLRDTDCRNEILDPTAVALRQLSMDIATPAITPGQDTPEQRLFAAAVAPILRPLMLDLLEWSEKTCTDDTCKALAQTLGNLSLTALKHEDFASVETLYQRFLGIVKTRGDTRANLLIHLHFLANIIRARAAVQGSAGIAESVKLLEATLASRWAKDNEVTELAVRVFAIVYHAALGIGAPAMALDAAARMVELPWIPGNTAQRDTLFDTFKAMHDASQPSDWLSEHLLQAWKRNAPPTSLQRLAQLAISGIEPA